MIAFLNAYLYEVKWKTFDLDLWFTYFQLLDETITACLQAASDNSCNSLSIPALGTGLLKYPASEVAKTTLKSIENFSNNNTSTSIKYVNIVVFYKDEAIFNVSRCGEVTSLLMLLKIYILKWNFLLEV